MQLEVTETRDVSRDGVLVRCGEELGAPGSRAWIVFPYDAAETGAFEPETPARVARVERDAGEYRIGLMLEPHRTNGTLPPSSERRALPRVALCLPIFLRTEGMPWAEEAMRRDFSWRGMRFETSRVYNVGETVRTKIPWNGSAKTGEVLGRVVRVEPGAGVAAPAGKVSTAGAAFNCVAVQLAGHG